MSYGFSTAFYEGEAFTSQSGGCAASTANFPYIGTGYLDMGGNGSYAEWNNINVVTAGKYTLIIKYANGSGTTRPCDLAVNGAAVKTIDFPSVYNGDWTKYWNARVVVDLNSGDNIIRLTANSANGGPNIDNIAVSSNGLSAPPAPLFNVRTYGAKGDGATNDRTAIQNAINACTAGGSVVLDSGTFMSGQIILKSDMTLWISEKAMLKAIQDTTQYPDALPATDNVSVWKSGTTPGGGHELKIAFVYANNARNVAISGGGKIDGNDKFAPWDGTTEIHRPIPVYITQSAKVTLSCFDIQNSAMWDCIPLECDSVVIDGININSPDPRNRDGIDICDCHTIAITNCTIAAGDDAICPKSGSVRGIYGVTVKNVTVNQTTASGIKFGTLSYGSLKGSTFEDITIKGGRVTVGIESVDGADVDSLTFSRLKSDSTGTCVFIVLGAGIRNRKPDTQPSKFGSIANILIQDVDCRNVSDKIGSSITGTIRGGVTYRPQNIFLKNIVVTPFGGGLTTVPANPPEYSGAYPEYNMFGNLPAWGYYVRHAADVTFTNCSETVAPSDARPDRVLQDVLTTATVPRASSIAAVHSRSESNGGYRVFSVSGRLLARLNQGTVEEAMSSWNARGSGLYIFSSGNGQNRVVQKASVR
jgi:polygalacturonase